MICVSLINQHAVYENQQFFHKTGIEIGTVTNHSIIIQKHLGCETTEKNITEMQSVCQQK